MNKSDVKRPNTLGCPDQYSATHGKYTQDERFPPQQIEVSDQRPPTSRCECPHPLDMCNQALQNKTNFFEKNYNESKMIFVFTLVVLHLLRWPWTTGHNEIWIFS